MQQLQMSTDRHTQIYDYPLPSPTLLETQESEIRAHHNRSELNNMR